MCVRDAVGNKHQSAGSGRLNVRVQRDDGTFYNLPNAGMGTVLSSLMYNLMSVSQLCSNGFTVIFKDKKSRIVTPDGDVIPLVESKGLYFLPAYSNKDPQLREVRASKEQYELTKGLDKAYYANLMASTNTQRAMLGQVERASGAYRKNPGRRYWKSPGSVVGARNAAAEWHRVHRLAGHPSREVTDGMVRSGKFGRIPMCDERDKFCEVCARAAFSRPPVLKGTASRTQLIGQRWHTDLAGPFKRDRNGVKYAMNILDDATGYVYVAGLKKKSDAVAGFKGFIRWLRRQRGQNDHIRMISQLQTDRGGEFTSGPEGNEKRRSVFDQYCLRHDVARRLTSALSPSQNGRAERANRTLFSTMRCSLMESKLGWSHWFDAYKMGAYARNRVPKKGGRPSSYERFYRREPGYKRMVPFGTVAYIQYKKTDKKSLDRSTEAQVIGYPDDTPGWVFKVPGNARPYATSHARFDKSRTAIDRALAGNGDYPVGFVRETEGTDGLPLGGTDSDIRAAAQRYQTDVIRCSQPAEGPTAIATRLRPRKATQLDTESILKHDSTITTAPKVPHRNKSILSDAETKELISLAREANCKLSFSNTHRKTGASGPRYDIYKSYTTFDDVDAAVLSGKMTKRDLFFDVKRGICTVLVTDDNLRSLDGSSAVSRGSHQLLHPEACSTGEDSLEQIEAHLMGLDEAPPVPRTPEGVIERLYYIRTKQKHGKKIEDKGWLQRLTETAHLGVVMGWNDQTTKHALDEFALLSINEVVCGKVTPLTIKQAKELPEWNLWLQSMKTELDALKKMGTFELVKRKDVPRKHRIIKTKFVYKIKQNSDGSIQKYKSRLIGQGFLLRWGIDYYDTYSSVVSYAALRTLLALSAVTNEQISKADIGNAYLESSPDEDMPVYVTQAPELEEQDPDEYVYKLKKSLYGMPFSGRTFQRVMEEFMVTLGFKRCKSDKCVYIKWVNGERIIVLTYVDDLISMTGSDYLRQWWKDQLNKRFAKVAYEDNTDWILNMTITRGRYADGRTWVQLGQELAISKIAKAAGLLESNRCPTPATEGEKLRATAEGDKLPSEEWSYSSILGGILYVANLTRPDIAFAANRLTRYLKNPNSAHCQALKRLVRYLYHTREIGVRYSSGSSNPFRLSAAADASFADCEDTKRSTLGWCQWIGGYDGKPSGVLTWGSRIGRNVALSTTESEVQAGLELLRDVKWMRAFLHELGYEQTGSTRVYEDNNGCMGQAQGTKGMKKARHYLVALASLNEAVHAGEIHMHRVDSKDNSADLFTKATGGSTHAHLSTMTLGYDMSFLKKSYRVAREPEHSTMSGSMNKPGKLRGSISDVDIVPRRSPRSNRGDCDNSTSNQMITNTTEGYENDNEVINPVVGYEKHLDQKDKVGVE